MLSKTKMKSDPAYASTGFLLQWLQIIQLKINCPTQYQSDLPIQPIFYHFQETILRIINPCVHEISYLAVLLCS